MGYVVYAIEMPNSWRWTLSRYTMLVVKSAANIEKERGAKPIIVAHSMGGLVLLMVGNWRQHFSAVALMAPIPKYGLRTVLPKLFRHPVSVFASVFSLNSHRLVNSVDLAHKRVFGVTFSQEAARRRMPLLGSNSKMAFVQTLWLTFGGFLFCCWHKPQGLPVAVVGFGRDTLVFENDIRATAKALGAEPVRFESMGHCAFLEERQEHPQILANWLDGWIKQQL
jgi:pimeloyl-ACP methyl ester carboxylesterase